MDFHDILGKIDYLRRLGVSHLYLSPILQASPGSTHGYDVTDPTRVNEELGGEEALLTVFEQASKAGMGVVLDIVPNHLAAIPENPWWWDVLEKGAASPHAAVFDINWEPTDPAMRGKILLPILGDHLASVVERGELAIVSEAGKWVLDYQGTKLPINTEGQELIQRGEPQVLTVLECQFYRLSHWQLGPEEINYRRFFDVGTLIGARIEDSAVFQATHAKLLALKDAGPVDGFRVDHPDGLRDPMGYFRKLREEAPDQWIIAEKILETSEALPASWPIDGTSGYDFLQVVGGLWVDPGGEKAITDFYADFTGQSGPYSALVREKKREVLAEAFEGDLQRLVDLLKQICNRRKLDHSRRILRELLVEMIASFPVYRTYVQPERGEISAADREHIALAIASARRRQNVFHEDLLSLLDTILTSDQPGQEEKEFIARFQQLTSPVMAKGVEDTAFYCYDRLLSVNEVGCDPARFGVAPGVFHEHNATTHAHYPCTMLATSTHDTKRSEDVRARISLISEIPQAWAEQVRLWSQHNLPAWRGREPDRSAEHLIYQTLVGAWPIGKDRIQDYMKKACREAGRFTNWTSPDEAYEERIGQFIETVLEDTEFISMLEDFIRPLVPLGRINSLSQTLLKLTSPGVPDFYQGSELWDSSLVDPDNRRPVDYVRRFALLEVLEQEPTAEAIMEGMEEGLPKMHLIRQALALRQRRAPSFGPGESGAYRPLLITGRMHGHLLAYSRGEDVAVVVPRLMASLKNEWHDTAVELPPGKWRNVLDHTPWESTARAEDLLRHFPVALLEKEQA